MSHGFGLRNRPFSGKAPSKVSPTAIVRAPSVLPVRDRCQVGVDAQTDLVRDALVLRLAVHSLCADRAAFRVARVRPAVEQLRGEATRSAPVEKGRRRRREPVGGIT